MGMDIVMGELALDAFDEVLRGRIARLAQRRGWDLQRTVRHVLEEGLQVAESPATAALDHSEADALAEALRALREVPDDPGYSMIGRIEAAGTPPG